MCRTDGTPGFTFSVPRWPRTLSLLGLGSGLAGLYNYRGASTIAAASGIPKLLSHITVVTFSLIDVAIGVRLIVGGVGASALTLGMRFALESKSGQA